MKSYKIYGTEYELSPSTKEPADAYALKGELLDDQPKGKFVGYVTMEDGSIIECYTKSKLILLLVPLILIVIGVIGFIIYLFVGQPKDVAFLGDIVKIGTDNNVVTYNGFPAIREEALSIQFTNGDYPATIQVTGEGVESQSVQVEPGQFVDTIPCKFKTEDGVVEATITIKTETSTQSFPIVVEIPDNLNVNDALNGLEGYWSGEQVYGAQ